MIINKLDEIKSKDVFVLPLNVQIEDNDLKIIHGNIYTIKISGFSNNKLRLIDEITLKNSEFFRGFLFTDLNNDGKKELLCGVKPFNLRQYKFKNNKFELQYTYNLLESIPEISNETEFEIRSILLNNQKDVILGSNIGIFIFSLDNNLKLTYQKMLFYKTNIWNIKNIKCKDAKINFFVISNESSIIIVDNEFELIGGVTINETIYQSELVCISDEIFLLFSCTKMGKLYVHSLNIIENEIKATEKIYFEKLVERSDRYSNDAINAFFIEEMNSNRNLKIIIGGNDYKLKFYEWNISKNTLEKKYVYNKPIEEIYFISFLVTKMTNYLLYVSYYEEISINTIKFYEYDFFLSFAKENREIVEKIADQLTVSKKLKVFYDKFFQSELIGENGYSQFEERIKNSLFFLPFISSDYIKKKWTQLELKLACKELEVRKKRFILPITLDNTISEDLPKEIIYIDFNQYGCDGIVDLLCKTIEEENRI